MIAVFIVDDQELIRRALSSVLSSDDQLSVTGSFGSAEEALEGFASKAPSVLLTDLEMPGIGGLELIRIVGEKFPETKVLALTTFETSENMKAAMKNGANGFLSKGSTALDIVAAVKLVSAGEIVMSPRTKQWLQNAFNQPESATESIRELALTPREVEVLELVSKGLSNSEIAKELFISPLTAKTHVAKLFSKLNVKTRAALVARAKSINLNSE